MIVEQRIYTLHPAQAQVYLRTYQDEGLAIQKPILGRLVGFYQTKFGELTQVIHMWAYEDLAERTARHTRLAADPGWQSYAAKVQPLIIRREHKLLIPAPFMQVKWMA
jgi:hypothetical protein